MKRVGIGVRMHSGWGVLVAITEDLEIVDRRRIEVISRKANAAHRGNQPYHRAAELGPSEGERYLSEYIAETDRFARKAIGDTRQELNRRGWEISAAALLLASGRDLPSLPQILASHPLIHTAEGELFRQAVLRACESVGIHVLRLRERELEEHARGTMGPAYSNMIRQIAGAGNFLGPPWTADHKAAALGGLLALSQTSLPLAQAKSLHGHA